MKKTYKIRFLHKVFLSGALIVASAIYVISQYLGNAPVPIATATTFATQRPAPSASSEALKLYANGTYIGAASDAYYGTMQVRAVVSSGRIATVQFLQHPSDRSTSRAINAKAMPILASEAVQSQDSSVNVVSGATFSSQAFEQSLRFALIQAQA